MISETKKKVLELFAEGRRHYKLMRFQEARECFARALSLDPEDCLLYTSPSPRDS